MTTRSVWTGEIARCTASIPDDVLSRAARAVLASRLIVTAGNGGSASIASHAAQAIAKPSYGPGGGRAAVCITDLTPILTAHANDGGWENALAESARPFLEIPDAALIAISSSGRSENVVRLAQLARECGRAIITFTGFSGEPLRSLATIEVHVDSHDYEVVEPVHDALLHRMQYHLRQATPPCSP